MSCPECNGAGFEGGNGPVVEGLSEHWHCHGSGDLAQPEPVNLRAVPRLDDLQFRRIFHEMEERRMQQEAFGL